MRPSAATALRKTCSTACRRGRICTNISTITPTKPNQMRCSPRGKEHDGGKDMTDSPVVAFKPKKSVALSGVTAGNTALCTVGKTGNDLHYRGYDILDIAAQCEFEEIAYLLVHEKLPNRSELTAYKTKLKALRGLPAAVTTVLEQLPPASHPMR